MAGIVVRTCSQRAGGPEAEDSLVLCDESLDLMEEDQQQQLQQEEEHHVHSEECFQVVAFTVPSVLCLFFFSKLQS